MSTIIALKEPAPPPPAFGDARLPERFWAKAAITEQGCWQWTAAANTKGYGRFRISRRTMRAHRVAYESLVGRIADGLSLDHLCRNRACVNPAHLEAVTTKVNTLRGQSFAAVNATKDRCDAGHPFDAENTYVWNGMRKCRACRRVTNRAAYARKRAALVGGAA